MIRGRDGRTYALLLETKKPDGNEIYVNYTFLRMAPGVFPDALLGELMTRHPPPDAGRVMPPHAEELAKAKPEDRVDGTVVTLRGASTRLVEGRWPGGDEYRIDLVAR